MPTPPAKRRFSDISTPVNTTSSDTSTSSNSSSSSSSSSFSSGALLSPASVEVDDFKFDISFAEMVQACEYLKCDESTKQFMLEILGKIQKDMGDIERFFPIRDKSLYYPQIRDQLEAIHRLTESIPNAPVLCRTIRSKVQEAICPLQEAIRTFFSQEEGMSDAQLVTKTQVFYTQQATIMCDDMIHNALRGTLETINKQLDGDGRQNIRCFISYAWPTAKNQKKEYWLQPFLRGLHGHLKQAGIKPVLDIVDNQVGADIVTFTNKIEKSEFALLVCTESLLAKHNESRFRVVQTELNLLRQKYDIDIQTLQVPRVFPFLMSGSQANAVLPEHNLYRTVRDPRKQSYVKYLEQLIGLICYPEGTSEAYQAIWRGFYRQYPALEGLMPDNAVQQALAAKWHKDEMEKLAREGFYQNLLSQHAQVSASSAAVSAAASPVYMAQEDSNKSQRRTSDEILSWHLPPSNHSYFVRREELLERLSAAFEVIPSQPNMPLTPVTLTACHGLGGIGKTQLAIYYMWGADKYTCRLWFLAESPEHLIKDYREFCARFKLVDNPSVSDRQVIDSVKAFIQQQPNILVVYDNAPDHNTIAPYIPSGVADVLVTSRHKARWPAGAKIIEVDIMSQDEAVALVRNRIEDKDPGSQTAEINDLVEELGHLPLALAQASAYIKENQISVREYLDLYQNEKRTLLSQNNLNNEEYPTSVAITWKITMAAIHQRQPKALEVLKCCAYLAPDDIPLDLFNALASIAYQKGQVEEMAAAEKKDEEEKVSQIFLNEVRTCLSNYSMVQYNSERKLINMHRLVQAILRFDHKNYLNGNVLSNNFSILTQQFQYARGKEKTEKLTKLLPHVIAFVENIEKILKSKDTKEEWRIGFIRLSYSIGIYYLDHEKDAKRAEKYLEKAKNLSLETDDGEERANIFQQLGNTYSWLKKKEEALLFLNQSINIRGEDDPKNFKALCAIANIYLRSNDEVQRELATSYLKRAEKIADNDSKKAMIHHYWGNYFIDCGKYEVDMAKKFPDNKELSDPYFAKGKNFFEKAKYFYEASLNIKEKENDVAEISRTNHQLAAACYYLEDFAMSFKYHMTTLRIRGGLYKKEDRDIKKSYEFGLESFNKIKLITDDALKDLGSFLDIVRDIFSEDSKQFKEVNDVYTKIQAQFKHGVQESVVAFFGQNNNEERVRRNSALTPEPNIILPMEVPSIRPPINEKSNAFT